MIVAGFAMLAIGGDLLVRGAVGLSLRLGISSFVVAAVVVGFGSSFPELVTSLDAALLGSPGIAVGNIVGSNIANILLVLGLAAVISPLCLNIPGVKGESITVLGACALFGALCATISLTFVAGLILAVALAAYLARTLMRELRPEEEDDLPPVEKTGSFRKSATILIIGMVLLFAGGHSAVTGAVGLARSFGLSETVVGLTIIAIGTTLPEIVTAVVAAMRGHSEVALGNVLGSCVFNVLAIGAVVGLAVPGEVPGHIVHFDNPVMLAAAILLVVLILTRPVINRGLGGVLLGGYGIYFAALWV